MVNAEIAKDHAVVCEEMSKEEALASGAIGLFVDKYGDRVKVYSIGDFSKEICGGPHAERVGGLGRFKIKKEESVSRGVRRVKAVLE
jgi:alanyl-tRNA synthetase